MIEYRVGIQHLPANQQGNYEIIFGIFFSWAVIEDCPRFAG